MTERAEVRLQEHTPCHVGVILDGNRRFAKRLMYQPWKGHEWGSDKVKSLLEWCVKKDIRELTLYAFSLQDFKRPKEEFDYLMGIFERVCDEELNEKKMAQQGISVRMIGRVHLLPQSLQEKIRSVENMSVAHPKIKLNICLAYGGREEITDAMKIIAQRVKEGEIDVDAIDESIIARHLALPSEPDLIIRTGGEKRTSNFLPWQSIYSELYFSDVLWPEFTEQEFDRALASFADRKRRFGA